MFVQGLRFITLVLAALSLTMESAHVLELPQKMNYEAQMYAAVNTTLYRYFAVVGGIYQVGAILAAAVLTFVVRRNRRMLRWSLAGAVGLGLAFGIWLTVVMPVNREIEAALSATPEAVPGLWMTLRERWEYGHAAGFVAQLVGFCALVISVLVAIPRNEGSE